MAPNETLQGPLIWHHIATECFAFKWAMSSYCAAVMSCQAERRAGQEHRAAGQTEWAERTDGPDVRTERGLRQAASQTDRQTDRQTKTDRLSAPASASPAMSRWSCGTHVENPGMMQLSKSRSISGPCLQPWGQLWCGINTVLMLGIDTVWGYNYAWHEVMRGLEDDPQTERRSQSPPAGKHEFKETTTWSSGEYFGGWGGIFFFSPKQLSH